MTLTRAQGHAIDLLEIQDAKRGWAKRGTLRSCGISSVTMHRLHVMGLVEMRLNPSATFGDYNDLFRLTADGENEAATRKVARFTARGKPPAPLRQMASGEIVPA
jgi:hypothetical protein